MIKLFSEKVRPTFTSSKHNIIIVESHEEVFFDVFEFEINGTKYIAEKCAEYNGSPVVSIPVEEDNEVKDIPFILTQGESFNVFFNTNNKTWSSKSPVITENISIGNEVVSIDSNKQALDREISNTQKLAGEYTERLKLEKVLEEATALVENNNHNIEEFLTNSKIDLLEEFNSFTLKSKFELEKYTDTKHKEIEQNITKSSNTLFKEFVADNKDKLKLISESLSDKIDYLVEATISSKFTSVSGDIANKHKDIASSVRDEINLKNKECIEYVDNFKEVLTEQNVILNDTIKKGVDKALSRIGNTKLDINNRIDVIEQDVSLVSNKIDRIDVIEQDVSLVSNKIEKYYDDKLGYLEKFFSEDVITNIEKLIDDSKLNLLDQVKQDGNYLKESVLEEKHDPKIGAKEFDNSIKKLRSELEKSVSTKFTNEVNSLKRLIEYSSGGGTVAKQFADGGVMRGDLTVLGTVSADCGDSNDWCSTYTTVSSNSATWGAGGIYDDSLLQANSGNWNSTYTTVGSNSADWESTYTTVDTYSADWASGGSGDFCGKVVTMDQLSSCGAGTISVSANLDVNDNTIDNVHSIQFHLEDTLAPVEGNLNWNVTEGTLDLGLKGSAGNELGVMLGMEQVLKVKSTEDIVRGQVVYISSAQGSHPLVSIASNTSRVASHAVAGIAAHDINANQFGYITTQGILSGVNTSGISAGDNIYLGANGSLTSVVPTTPDLEVRLGYCIIGSVAPEGKMYVSIELGFDMEDLHDVSITSIQDKDILSYNSSTSAYENVTSNNWQSTFTTMSTNSANWDSTYTTVSANSATWVTDLDNVVTSPDTDPVAETTQLAEIIQITQAGYNALSPPAANTLYIIID